MRVSRTIQVLPRPACPARSGLVNDWPQGPGGGSNCEEGEEAEEAPS